MSYQAVHWALYDAPMLATGKGNPDATARQVLVVLAEHAADDGTNTYPSPLKIRYATGLDERTIQRALLRLERGGLIARDGTSPLGTTRWKLALGTVRPESEWPEMVGEADRVRRAESRARIARRHRQSRIDTETESGTQSAGVRDAESRSPARRVPDVRDATPPEPPEQPPGNRQAPTTGGTLPPDPLRPQDPTPSDLGNGTENSIYEGDHLDGDQEGNHRPHARAHARDPTAERGNGFCLTCHTAGVITLAADPVNGSRCLQHLRTAA